MNNKLKFGLLLLAVMALVLLPEASARESYATETGALCSRCHVDPNGGGTLTADGEYYNNNNHQLPPNATATTTATTTVTATTTATPVVTPVTTTAVITATTTPEVEITETETQTETEAETEAGTETETGTEKSPGFGGIIAVFAVAMLASLMKNNRYRR